MQQRVAAGEVDVEPRRIAQPPHTAFFQGSEQEPKPSDRDRVRIDIDSVHAIERPLNQHRRLRSRLLLPPALDQPGKAAEQEVPAAAGRVDHLEAVVGMEPPVGFEPRLVARLGEAEFLDRRVERPVEDELLDEDRRLEQRVPLPCLLGEVLVEVAQEPRVPGRVGEVVDQRPRVRVDPLEEAEQLSGRIAAEPVREIADRVVLAEDVLGRRTAPQVGRKQQSGNRGR